MAADCSERSCPTGLSWYSYPTADNLAHNVMTECADMGLCDRNTGKCVCHEGFYGQACEYMMCGRGIPGACNGHGRCLSMFELAQAATVNGDAAGFSYGLDPNNANTWDAHRIFGCLCDEGFEGYDCSLRSCPTGDDPGTYDDVDEVQLLQCIATDGYFALNFRQQTTPLLLYNSTAAEVETALESLSSIASDVVVTYLNVTDTGFCSSTGTGVVRVTFKALPGDLPAVRVDRSLLANGYSNNGEPGTGQVLIATDGVAIGNYTSVQGTKENAVCNNRGLCDYTAGKCTCVTGWGSSDGMGNMGDRGDCGYRKSLQFRSDD